MPTEGRSALASGGDGPARRPWRRWPRDVVIAVLIGLSAFLVYNANLRAIAASDTYAARYLPFSIWRNHTVVLDPIATTVAQGRRLPTGAKSSGAYWVMKGRGGHLVSKYPTALPVVVAPLYLPAVLYLDARGWDPLVFDQVARLMEKLCASLLAAASVALLYLLLRRRAGERTAALLTFVYAFGTATWVVSSQALWMHGLAELLVVSTLLLLTGRATPLRAMAVGLFCALMAANRQPDAILAAGLGLYALWWGRRWIPAIIGGGVIPVALTVAYNLMAIGHLAGGYGLEVHTHAYNDDWLGGVAGLLFSPTRGLLVFSPFLLFVPGFRFVTLRQPGTRALTAAIAVAMAVQVGFYAMIDWRQGVSWGPRWLIDMLPMLMWMLPPVVNAFSRFDRILFGLVCGVAIALEVVGAFWYTGVSSVPVISTEGPGRMAPAWDGRNAPFIAELKHPPAAPDLWVDLKGSLDAINVTATADQGARQVELLGWALTDRRSPADVAAILDGGPTAGTSGFFARPDVARALGDASPAGWRIVFPADRLAPGDHTVAILVRAHSDGEPRLLLTRRFTVRPPSGGPARVGDMTDAARRAGEVLADHQQASGYFLTQFTSAARFERPHPELNTYLNALMLDVAGPVAKAAGMDDVLARTRHFLSEQIEPDGLVRYHGLPDAPTIGTLGCAITPDSDDTTLAWRTAPGGHRGRLAKALATIEQYRRPDGLYRTWLAPRNRYQCLDPGKDPNPADIGIQMHIYLLLAGEKPEAARALCQALIRKAGDEDIWVYYAGAPPVPILRLAELHKAGCPLELPAARLRTDVPGQAVWVEASRALLQMETAPGNAVAHQQVEALLRQIAADDFALLRRDPPLLYHNDLTASVRRYYWSPELGYALWLRLYFESGQAQSGSTR